MIPELERCATGADMAVNGPECDRETWHRVLRQAVYDLRGVRDGSGRRLLGYDNPRGLAGYWLEQARQDHR